MNDFTSRQSETKSSPYTLKKPFYILTFIGIVTCLYLYFKPSTTVISPIPQQHIFSFLPSDFSASFLSRKKNPDDLKKIIMESAEPVFSQYSIVVKDLHSDFSVDIGENIIFTGASVNKLFIFGTLYYLIQKGEIDPDKKIVLQADDIQDYGTGSIRYDPPGTMYSIKTLAHLMIQKSDNTAAYILGRYVIGIPKIQNLIDIWGLSQTDMENNKTSNTDVKHLMEKMYQEKIANKALTLEMFSFLKDGTIEDRIPALLPPGTTVYHKTGNEVGFLHDVGIVVGPKTTYYVGIFTSDVSKEAETIQAIATISRKIYDFMK